MKGYVNVFVSAAVGLTAGWMANMCQHRGEECGDLHGYWEADTVRYQDTIGYHEPEAKAEVSLGTEIKYLRVYKPKEAGESGLRPRTETNLRAEDSGLRPRTETNLNSGDSVAVEIEIVQREYEGNGYRAWVSGYEPRLDSIMLIGEREVVTIKKPPDKRRRWHIGPSVGCGVTPQGMQPYVGVSVTYSLFSF